MHSPDTARTDDSGLTRIVGKMPYRMALAGGWIDQPFVSQHNPCPPGSMVVVGLQPFCRFMDRAGMGTSTRKIAAQLWGDELPARDPRLLARELFDAENRGRADPSGSQDMIGLIYPGVNRLDYDFDCEGGTFPATIESCQDPGVAAWLEDVLWMVPVAPRPAGYNPLGIKRLDPNWIQRLGQTGRDCYDAILAKDVAGLGASMNDCMECWEAILPQTVQHPTITVNLLGILRSYQERYAGAMYSGCGGGYLYVAAEEPVPGGFKVQVRVGQAG